jgi:anti-sigma factor (TIGR02949 family)
MDRWTCEETFRRLDDFLDRELSAAEMAAVQEHLDTCQVCASEFAFEAGVLQHVRAKLRRIDAPKDLLAKVALKIEQARSENSEH